MRLTFIIAIVSFLLPIKSGAALAGVLYDSSTRLLSPTNVSISGLRSTNLVAVPGSGASNSLTVLGTNGVIVATFDKDGNFASTGTGSLGTQTAAHVLATTDLTLAGTNIQTTLTSLQTQISGTGGAPSGTVVAGSLTAGVIPVASSATNLIDGYLKQSGGYILPTNAVVGMGSSTNGLMIVAIDGGTVTTTTNLPALLIKQRAQNGSGFFTNILVVIDDASYDLNHSQVISFLAKSRANPLLTIDYIGDVIASSSVTAANFFTAGNVTVGTGGGVISTIDGLIYWRGDGIIQMAKAAVSDFVRLEFGGSTIGGGSSIGYPSMVILKSAANSGNVPIINFANGAATTFSQATNFCTIQAYDLVASHNISTTGGNNITTDTGTVSANAGTVSGATFLAGSVTLTNSIIPATSVVWKSGSGSPEGVVTSAIGGFYTRTDGGAGTTLYVKESGSGSIGWIAK